MLGPGGQTEAMGSGSLAFMTHRWLLLPGLVGAGLFISGAGCSTPCEDTLTCDVGGDGGAGASSNAGTGGEAGGGGTGTRALGASCSAPNQCESGFCVDDVCCESACDDLCETCGATAGTCTAHDAGTDPDDDCGAAVCVASGDCGFGQVAWSKQFGVTPGNGATDETPNAVVADAQGRVYAIGDFDAGNAFAQNSLDIRRFSDTGSPGYTLSFSVDPDGGPPFISVYSARVTSSGGLLVSGYYEGTVDWGQGPVTADGDAFVALVESAGSVDWMSKTADPGIARAYGSAVANDGVSTYFAGGYALGESYAGVTFPAPADFEAPFLAKVSGAGAAEFATAFPATTRSAITDIAVGDNDVVYVAGVSSGGVNLGSTPLPGGSFIAKLDANANHAWSKAFSNTFGLEAPTGLVRGADGALYFTALFSDPINLGAGEITSGAAGVTNTFIARFDDNGDLVWATPITSSSELSSARMVVDSVGDVVFAVTATGSVTIDGVTVTPNLSEEAVIGKLRPDGTLRWARGLGATTVADIAVDPSDNILAIGTFEVPITLGNDSYTPLGERDVFLVKLSP